MGKLVFLTGLFCLLTFWGAFTPACARMASFLEIHCPSEEAELSDGLICFDWKPTRCQVERILEEDKMCRNTLIEDRVIPAKRCSPVVEMEGYGMHEKYYCIKFSYFCPLDDIPNCYKV